ncbi:hypothetical protein B0H14DRAFT_3755431 [Mycena olivaceomarginata]|nr:hypothetical protein B0H14DRAFT_3755431 [Mycena olivaceomarginata]
MNSKRSACDVQSLRDDASAGVVRGEHGERTATGGAGGWPAGTSLDRGGSSRRAEEGKSASLLYEASTRVPAKSGSLSTDMREPPESHQPAHRPRQWLRECRGAWVRAVFRASNSGTGCTSRAGDDAAEDICIYLDASRGRGIVHDSDDHWTPSSPPSATCTSPPSRAPAPADPRVTRPHAHAPPPAPPTGYPHLYLPRACPQNGARCGRTTRPTEAPAGHQARLHVLHVAHTRDRSLDLREGGETGAGGDHACDGGAARVFSAPRALEGRGPWRAMRPCYVLSPGSGVTQKILCSVALRLIRCGLLRRLGFTSYGARTSASPAWKSALPQARTASDAACAKEWRMQAVGLPRLTTGIPAKGDSPGGEVHEWQDFWEATIVEGRSASRGTVSKNGKAVKTMYDAAYGTRSDSPPLPPSYASATERIPTGLSVQAPALAQTGSKEPHISAT